MRRSVCLFALSLVGACSAPNIGPEPSLAPRPAEAIDPRLPISGDAPAGPADAALAAQLQGLIAEARAGVSQFNARQADADRLAAAAGPMASESWVAAQQALSLLIEQYGVTTRVAGNIDGLASARLEAQHWIRPSDQQAIASAAAEVATVSDAQSAAIDRLKNQLAR
jgi:hypothetical protein